LVGTGGHAQASSSDQVLALGLLGPGDPIDPVLSALADGRLVRDVVAPLPGAATVPAVPLGFAFTGPQLGVLDITATTPAIAEVRGFTDRLRRRGIDPSGTEWTVYALPPIEAAPAVAPGEQDGDGPLGDVLVVPRGTQVNLVGAVFEDGQLHAKTQLTATGAAPRQHRRFQAVADPSASAQFQRAGGIGCVERKQNNTAWYDPCQDFWLHQNDGDPNAQYWASQMRGTGKGKSVWTLNSLEVSSRRTEGSAPQEWVDWDPGADANTNCRNQTISVSYAGAGVSFDKQHCEMWDIDKDQDGADFANWWRGHVRRKERETGALTLTRLANGDVPVLRVDFDYYANP
jgi:hypothetical protein